jgi:MYXO-CTERM domain-containing protein
VQEGRDYFNDMPMPGYVPYVYPHPLNDGPGGTAVDGGTAGKATDGGCGCRLASNRTSPGWVVVAGVMLALVRRARRAGPADRH